jgi:hypothetical protein
MPLYSSGYPLQVMLNFAINGAPTPGARETFITVSAIREI